MTATKMTPRQRVFAALNHEEPDTVPLALGGGPYGIVDDLYLRLIDLLDLGEPVPPFRAGHNISYMDDRLLERLGTDIRYCWPSLMPNSPINPGPDENTFYDSYGQVWKRALSYYYSGDGILREATSIDDIERLVRWPNLSNPHWMTGVTERARNLNEETDYFVVMRMVTSHGPFQTACDLRGTENFLKDMVRNREFAKALLEKVTIVIESLLKQAMQAGGKYFHMIELPGDDYASNTNTMMSPAMFQTFIKPCIERLVMAVKEENPKTKIMLHSDGAITNLIHEFISLGIDVLHPLEPLPNTDFVTVKETFGKKIAILGGIDISNVMPGSNKSVIEETKLRIAQLAPGGGYVLAPSNHLQADVPPENVITLFETARKFGKYPINF